MNTIPSTIRNEWTKRHINVCICTFKRPALLGRLLSELARQQTEGLFTYSMVVADNDVMQSGRQVVADFAASSDIPATYCLETEKNIALARNKALEQADGDFIAFIDDDEYPSDDWLLNLLRTCNSLKVDGVLGPVKPYFEHKPPQWIVKGGFFERPEYVTGYELRWPETRTGNVLFRRDILGVDAMPFRPEFGLGGEDRDFFRRMIGRGHRFVWCNEAVVYELVPPSRCTRSFLLKRAVLWGGNVPVNPKNRISNLIKSVIAVPVYALALPVLALFGQHMFIKYLMKLSDHASRLLTLLGFKLVREREM